MDKMWSKPGNDLWKETELHLNQCLGPKERGLIADWSQYFMVLFNGYVILSLFFGASQNC